MHFNHYYVKYCFISFIVSNISPSVHENTFVKILVISSPEKTIWIEWNLSRTHYKQGIFDLCAFVDNEVCIFWVTELKKKKKQNQKLLLP